MKVAIADLIKVLTEVNKALPTTSANQSLLYCKLTVKDNVAYFAAFNLNVLIEGKVNLENELLPQDFSILIPSQAILELVQKIKGDLVEFQFTDLMLTINGKYKIPCLDSNDYPELPDTDGVSIDFSIEKFLPSLIFASASISNDETRKILNGINISGDGPILASTNGITLSMINLGFNHEVPNITVDKSGITILIKSIKKMDGTINIQFGTSYIKFSYDNYVLITRILNGNYPKYQQLIPTKFTRSAIVNTNDFIESLERLSILSGSTNEIILCLENNMLSLIVNQGELGTGSEDLFVQVDGDKNKINIYLNLKLFLNGIKQFTSELIKVNIVSNLSPMVLMPVVDNQPITDMIYLIMPMNPKG